jgi:uncharacterized membrane protein
MENAVNNNNINKRAGFLDEVRGFAIICMVVYHGAFSLEQFYKVKVPFLFEDWFFPIWAVFAGSFIFISGIVCRYSRNNVKRGAQCFLLGMGVTFATAIAAPEVAIQFGILHFMGICMMLYGLGEKLWDCVPPLAGIGVCVLLFTVTWSLRDGSIGIGALSFAVPDVLGNVRELYPLGLYTTRIASGDFFPLMPWGFLFAGGSYVGVYVRSGRCPDFFYSTRVPFLAAAGRYTIWIYLLHQPIIMGVLYLIYG